nr:sigma-70 family RNA polymerase sigma factor [uncultured Allomuricauda sp.]
MKDYQNKLFPYAYNILGSTEDAKDVVQEILIKFHQRKEGHIENDLAYLAKSVINQSINTKKRKQKYFQVWLPEPISTERADANIDSNKIISYSMLVLLEKLTPKERAVFILKEAFDYSHKEIAEAITLTVENSRKLLSRARLKLDTNKEVNLSITSNTPMSYLKEYVESIKSGDVKRLEAMLSQDIVLTADGGGEIKVVRELTQGIKATIKLLLFVFKTYQQKNTIKIAQINHQPALLYFENSTLVNCQIFEIKEGKIFNIYTQLAPGKLKNLGKMS